MTTLLINGSTMILDYGDITEDALNYYTPMYSMYPKQYLANWYGIVEAEVPSDFAVSTHEWDPVNHVVVEKLIPVDLALQAQNIAACLTDYDAFYDALFGRRETELLKEESAARDFAAAEYTGTVPDYVATYAANNAAGAQTDQVAAQEIIERADARHATMKAMHLQRQVSQAQMRAATLAKHLKIATVAWKDFLHQKRVAHGLPTGPGTYAAMAPIEAL